MSATTKDALHEGHPIHMLDEVRGLLRDKSQLAKLKDKTKQEVAEAFDTPLLKGKTLYENFFDEIVELETEVAILHKLFKQKKVDLTKALSASKTPKSEEIIAGFQEQLDAIAVPLFYCNHLLFNYYHTYSNKELEKKHQGIANEVEKYLTGMAHQNDKAMQSVVESIKQQAKSKAIGIIEALWRASKLRDTISEVNIERIYWIFCHLAVNESIYVGEQLQIIDIKGGQTFMDGLDLANPALNFISVAFYGARLLIELGMLFKHTFTRDADESSVYWTKRLSREWDKRKISILNNIIWGIGNIVTNYTYAGLPISNQITAAVLIIDVLFNVWAMREEQKKYKKAKSSFEAEIENIEKLRRDNQKKLDDLTAQLIDLAEKAQLEESNKEEIEKQKQVLILEKQSLETKEQMLCINLLVAKEKLAVLNRDWQIKKNTLRFNINASIILMGSFVSAAAGDLAMVIPSIAPTLTPIFSALGILMIFGAIYQHNKPLAFLVAGGLAAATYFAPPVGLLLSFVIGMAAIAIYLSSKEIAALEKAKLDYIDHVAMLLFDARKLSKPSADITLEDIKAEIKEMSHASVESLLLKERPDLKIDSPEMKKLDELMANIQKAKLRLAIRVTERTVLPILILFAFATYWPAGVAIITAYLIYKIGEAVAAHKKATEAAKAENESEAELAEKLSERKSPSPLGAFGLFKAPIDETPMTDPAEIELSAEDDPTFDDTLMAQTTN